MMEQKRRSLGEMEHANLEVTDQTLNEVRLKVTTWNKTLRLTGSPVCAAHQLVQAAQKIAENQRKLTMQEWRCYQELQKITGYKHPEDT